MSMKISIKQPNIKFCEGSFTYQGVYR